MGGLIYMKIKFDSNTIAVEINYKSYQQNNLLF